MAPLVPSSRNHPQLSGLVKSGALRVIRKPVGYDEDKRERRFWRGKEKPREPECIYVVGTCHVSSESARDVQAVIECVRPQAVVVELCKKRSGALNVEDGSSAMGAADGRRFDSQSPQLSGPSGLWRELASSDSREGGLAERSARWLMRNIMSSQADRLGRELNVLPGAEFRQAVISGREVGAEIVLGDRPIDITLKRCWANMSARERWKLGLVLASTAFNQDEVTRQVASQISSTEEALDLDLVFEQVTGMFPGLVEPLFNERDRYMAWTLKRSKAVTNCREVVGVIGRGHLDAVCKEIERDYSAQHLSFKRVARLKH
ncbi:TraB domain-containing protein [Chloropicon roscoffensis]|uniref:TraB domain-containing protein n=1 Tax=Chloropicon roscoffensis TaxID=1461544 RepID=A0AAX4PMV7_9CHLO